MRSSLAASILLLTACSGPDVGDVGAPSRAAITGGTNFGGLYVVQVENTTVGGTAGGVLVGRRAVLTRAAIASPTDTLRVTFGADQVAPIAAVMGASFQADPDFGPTMLGRDVGIVELASDAPASVTPVPIAYTTPAVGTVITLAGFGATSSASTDLNQLRSGESTIASTTGMTWLTATTGSLGCRGDVGGAVLIGAPGAYQLVGMLGPSDPSCAVATPIIPLAPVRAWAEPVLTGLGVPPPPPEDGGASGDAGSGADAGTTTSGGGCCSTAGPTGDAAPALFGLALTGIAVLARRRRRA